MARNAKKAAQAAAAPAQAPAETPKPQQSAPAETPKPTPPAPGAETPKDEGKGVKETLTSFAQMCVWTVAEMATWLKGIVREYKAVETAKDKTDKNLKRDSKIVAAFKRIHAQKRDAQEIPGDWTFKDYFKNVSGGELPGRVEQMASLFNSLCQTFDASGKPLLAEEIFNDAKNSWLQAVNPIVKEAQRNHPGEAWKTCDDVLDVINALSKPGDPMEKIKDVRERQKGKTTAETDAEGNAVQPLTLGRCFEFIKAAIKNGQNALAAGKQTETFDLFAETFRLHDTWVQSGVPASTLKGWTSQLMENEKSHTAPHIQVIRAETPALANVETPAAALAS